MDVQKITLYTDEQIDAFVKKITQVSLFYCLYDL